MKPEPLPETGAPSPEAAHKKNKIRHPLVFVIGTIVLASLLFWLGGWMLKSFSHETTDDAFLDAHIVTVAPKVAGLISTIYIKQNQFVKKGDPLLEIDPRDFEARVAQKHAAAMAAEANTKTILASFELLKAKIETAQLIARQSKAEAALSEATSTKADSDFKRNQDLKRRSVISPQEFDAATTTAAAARANLEAAREKLAGDESKVHEAEAQLEAAKSAIDASTAQAKQAKADVTAAELDLSYARISSPIDGRITNKRVESGDYIQVGQALFAIVPDDLWVTANFKETQLKKIRTNQPVEIEIDSVEDTVLRGHVESIQSGSGARFSLLPPENAVGNFVKVVQRVPVKIVFDEPLNILQALGPGMSVTPSVQIKELHVSPLARIIAASGLAILIGWLLWFLTDPKRKG